MQELCYNLNHVFISRHKTPWDEALHSMKYHIWAIESPLHEYPAQELQILLVLFPSIPFPTADGAQLDTCQ